MLLMMGGETPETCWATRKRQVIILDFKLSPCFICNALSFGYLPGVWVLKADVSARNDVSSHCIKCSETSAFSTETPGRYPKENALRQVINLWNCCILLVELFESKNINRRGRYPKENALRQVINLWNCCILLVELFESKNINLHVTSGSPFSTY